MNRVHSLVGVCVRCVNLQTRAYLAQASQSDTAAADHQTVKIFAFVDYQSGVGDGCVQEVLGGTRTFRRQTRKLYRSSDLLREVCEEYLHTFKVHFWPWFVSLA